MGAAPHFPDAVAEVNAWLEVAGAGMAQRRPELELGERCAVWRLAVSGSALRGTKADLVLMQDFPARPARIIVSPALCLKLPHVEEDGNLCHGVQPDGNDLADPKAAVGRVLVALDEFLTNCLNAGWREAEFQRERLNYWSRWTSSTKRPTAFPADELRLDVPTDDGAAQVIEAVLLADTKKAFATSKDERPEAVAKAWGWPVGTITRGSAMVVSVEGSPTWTPSTWPRSFADVNAFLSDQTGNKDLATRWYRSTKWPNKAPLFIVIKDASAAFAWSVVPNPVQRNGEPSLLPVTVTRVDRAWSLSRDRHPERLAQRTAKRVAILGAGSLGSAVAELLVRAGVGHAEVVDIEDFAVENISRHLLGMPDLDKPKSQALAGRLNKSVPGADVLAKSQSASNWAASLSTTAAPDLVIDCTGERSVRLALSELRGGVLQGVPVVMGWMEPFGAASHVVLTAQDDRWPASDPTDTHINYATWPDDTFIALPACGQGFHEYGVADAWSAASLLAEKVLDALSSEAPISAIWSRVRSHDFFAAHAPGMTYNRENPCPQGLECVVVRRSFEEVVNGS